MSLFKKNKPETTKADPYASAFAKGPQAKKGKPTPKRKQQEARNFRPQVAGDKKAAKQRAKEARDRQFQREQLGLQTGQENLLPLMHRGAARRFVRNWIDARYTFCEWMVVAVLFLMLGGILVSAFFKDRNTSLMISNVSMLLAYAVLIIGAIEGVILTSIAARKAKAKFGTDKDFPRGLRWYAFSRAILVRRWRSPRPQVRRGDEIN